jgi:predicted fused transcriptional regulator/phosphomethylpyrimidine kinase
MCGRYLSCHMVRSVAYHASRHIATAAVTQLRLTNAVYASLNVALHRAFFTLRIAQDSR